MFLFFTHSGAIKFDRLCKKSGLVCQLIPVPRLLSSNCGVSGQVDIEGPLDPYIDRGVEKIYRQEGDSFQLVYDGEDKVEEE